MASISLPAATAIAAGVGTVGAAVSAYGVYEQGQAGQAAANYQSQIARNNATIANQNAQYAIAAGNAKAQATSLQNAAVGGRIRAAEAANQIDVNTGSATDVQQSQREAGTLSTLTEENNALLQAYGYKAAAASDTAQAGIDTATGQQAAIAGDIGSAGSVLGNASSVGFKWTQAQNPGAPQTPQTPAVDYGLGSGSNPGVGS